MYAALTFWHGMALLPLLWMGVGSLFPIFFRIMDPKDFNDFEQEVIEADSSYKAWADSLTVMAFWPVGVTLMIGNWVAHRQEQRKENMLKEHYGDKCVAEDPEKAVRDDEACGERPEKEYYVKEDDDRDDCPVCDEESAAKANPKPLSPYRLSQFDQDDRDEVAHYLYQSSLEPGSPRFDRVLSALQRESFYLGRGVRAALVMPFTYGLKDADRDYRPGKSVSNARLAAEHVLGLPTTWFDAGVASIKRTLNPVESVLLDFELARRPHREWTLYSGRRSLAGAIVLYSADMFPDAKKDIVDSIADWANQGRSDTNGDRQEVYRLLGKEGESLPGAVGALTASQREAARQRASVFADNMARASLRNRILEYGGLLPAFRADILVSDWAIFDGFKPYKNPFE